MPGPRTPSSRSKRGETVYVAFVLSIVLFKCIEYTCYTETSKTAVLTEYAQHLSYQEGNLATISYLLT